MVVNTCISFMIHINLKYIFKDLSLQLLYITLLFDEIIFLLLRRASLFSEDLYELFQKKSEYNKLKSV